MPALSARLRRAALETLGRDTLVGLADRFEVEVADRRSRDAAVDALNRSRKLDFGSLLSELSRDELKAICTALGLDTSGKEKGPIVERILASGDPGDGGGSVEATDGGDAAPGFALKPPEPKVKKERAPAAPRSTGGEPTGDYRHDATRKNNPPAGLIDLDKPPPQPRRTYAYDPHLDPQLQWAGKAEHTSFDVDTVSLHIHERISAQAIMRAVKREDAQRSLFGGDDLPESKAIDFYAHDVGWANRLVLGDSLLVMNSLLEREQMAGKVQCVFIDPPYGVKFNSNFQPLISRREVKDGDDRSLTREPEQIQAYRDTWTLGVHSYLTYLRDRLLLSRELLAGTGSVFVQISEDNLHHARELMDEVFGADNFVTIISFAKTSGTTSKFIPTSNDYIIWYAKDLPNAKYRQLYSEKSLMAGGGTAYGKVRLVDGSRRPLAPGERANPDLLPAGARVYRLDNVTSQSTGRDKGEGAACWFSITVEGKAFTPGDRATWKTNEAGMARLLASGRLESTGTGAYYVRYLDDFPAYPLSNVWGDTGIAGFASDKRYVVETTTKAIERCILMVTDPGDLVLDPTCGSGTTAFVAEQWGRRWVTCDTSRVALSLARQRLLTAKFPYFRLRSDKVRDGFDYKAVPHVTLKSIAQNPKLDECTTQEERDRAIRQSADKETLYDQPEEDKGKVRVSGPFTVEAIPVASMESASEAAAPLDADARQDDLARSGRGENAIDAGTDYVGYMIDLLKKSGGVHFKNGKTLPSRISVP